ncbi:MAG: inositol monophosphatase [Candidatus Pacebacteria bacterium]|nr:inositol monophosphatase [Candidatus Paceibacterota bacterium]
MKSHLRVLMNAAESGGAVLRQYFGKTLRVTRKSSAADFRTKADIESNAEIKSVLKSSGLGDFNIISEETGIESRGSDYTLIIDSLDGTNNFTIGLPYFAVAIALVKNREVVAAVVNDPMLRRVYCAEKGEGAYLNGQQISVGREQNITRATVSYICGYQNSRENWLRLDQNLTDLGVKRKTGFWCPALDFCQLASGKIESVINVNHELHDVVPGKFIAREAGAIITDLRGEIDRDACQHRFVASCSRKIHKAILTAV